jgi:phasin family protein
MPDFSFDSSAALNTYRSVFAPTLRAQQEALKTVERFSRYQFAVATDYFEWGVAHAKASLDLGTPAELTASQTTLATQFGEKLQGRVREFVNLTTEAGASFTQLLGETTAKVAEAIKKSA